MSAKRFFFLLSWMLALVVVAVVLLALRYPAMAYYDGEYPAWMEQKEFVSSEGDPSQEAEILFLGDSVMKASVVPEVLGPQTENLALGGGTPVEMQYALSTYLLHHPAPRAVFVGFYPVHYAEMEQFEKRTLYFHYLPWREACRARLRMLRMDGVPWYLWGSTVTEDASYLLRLPTKYWRTMEESGFARGDGNRRVYDEVHRARGHMLFGQEEDWTAHYAPYEGVRRPFRVAPSLDWYLRDMIRLCRSRGIAVYILRLPLEPLDARELSDSGYLAAFDAYLSRLSLEEGVPVAREQPVYEPAFFGDSMHPNARGAERYSREIFTHYHDVFAAGRQEAD